MFRINSLRVSTRASRNIHPRKLSTGAPPPGDPKPNNTNLWYFGGGAAALVGLYYFLYSRNQGQSLQAQTRADAESFKTKGREFRDAGKARAQDALKEVEHNTSQVRASAKDKLDSARSHGEDVKDQALSTASQYASQARDKVDGYKSSAQSSLKDVRDTAEKKFEDMKGTAEEDAKAVGSSWFAWGQSKAEQGKEQGERGKKEVASKVQDGAEEMRQRANRHT